MQPALSYSFSVYHPPLFLRFPAFSTFQKSKAKSNKLHLLLKVLSA